MSAFCPARRVQWIRDCCPADRLSVFYIADRIGLRIFQRDHGDRQIHLRRVCQFFILRHYIGEEILVNIELISPLFKCNAVYFFVLQRRRHIVRIDLDHIVIAFFLLFEDLQRLRLITRRDHTVGHLSLDQSRRIHVTDIGQRDKIAE